MNATLKRRMVDGAAIAMVAYGFLGLHGRIAVYMMTFDPGQSADAAKLLLTMVMMACGVFVAFGHGLPKAVGRPLFLLLSYATFLGLTAALHYLRDGWPEGGPDTYNQVVYLGTSLIAIATLAVTRRRFWG